MSVCIGHSFDKFTANTHHNIFLACIHYLHIEIADPTFVDSCLRYDIEVGSIINSFCYFAIQISKLVEVRIWPVYFPVMAMAIAIQFLQ